MGNGAGCVWWSMGGEAVTLREIYERIYRESQLFPKATDTTVDGWMVAIRKADTAISARINELESTIDRVQANADAAHELLKHIEPWINRLVKAGDRLVDGDSLDCEEIVKEFAEWWKEVKP